MRNSCPHEQPFYFYMSNKSVNCRFYLKPVKVKVTAR